MITIELPKPLELHFHEVVQKKYNGNIQVAIRAFLELDEKYGWKEQLTQDVKSIRSEVRKQGGMKQRMIEETIRQYRENPEA